MRGLSFIVIFASILTSCASMSTSRKKKSPVLLTSDYGVLDENDFESAAKDRVKPVPSYSPNSSYLYWQCFPRQQVALRCRSWEGEEPRSFLGEADIVVETENERHEYGFRRAFDLRVCEDHLKVWQKLSTKAQAVCLLGEPAGFEKKSFGGKTVSIKGWVWDRLKTKKGCDSYFEGDCDSPPPR